MPPAATLFLLLIGSAAAPARAAAPAWPGAAEASELARRIDASLEGDRLRELLERVDKDPGDLDARLALKRHIASIYVQLSRDMINAPRPLRDDPEATGLRDLSYRFLLQQVQDEVIQNVCRQGHQAFEDKRFFEAVDRFNLCKALQPGQPWAWASLTVCARMFQRSVRQSARTPEERDAYRSLAFSLRDFRWEEALARLRELLGLIESHSPGSPRVQELRDLEGPLRARVEAARDPGDMLKKVERGLALAEKDPEGAVSKLEALLYGALGGSDPEAFKRAGAALRQAYARRSVRRMLGAARAAPTAPDAVVLKKAAVEILEKDPQNREALELIGKGAPAADPVRAEAHYNRGLKAFLEDDLRRAAEEWRSALKLDPRHEPARRALARTERELEMSRTIK